MDDDFILCQDYFRSTMDVWGLELLFVQEYVNCKALGSISQIVLIPLSKNVETPKKYSFISTLTSAVGDSH